jgi:hypothetical protein
MKKRPWFGFREGTPSDRHAPSPAQYINWVEVYNVISHDKRGWGSHVHAVTAISKTKPYLYTS